MIWQDWAGRLRETLGLDGSPVGVAYSDTPAANGKEGRIIPCAAFYHAARRGSTFNISERTSVCPGGIVHLGLGTIPAERAGLVKRFLLEGEKFRSCSAAYFRSRYLRQGQPPLGVGKYVVVGPLEDFLLKPDLVLMVGTAAQASRLVTLATYETGIPLPAELSGSTCFGAVSYPLSTGRVNVSFIDPSTRHLVKGFKEGDIILGVPYFHLRGIVESIPLCTAGTAAPGMAYREVMTGY
ncbi:MAG: DUF169 domain-containing protein [Peptococcaceae bacterium]|nr:DUF169 domain-containing protein [Peptococcaceae bacterium]